MSDQNQNSDPAPPADARSVWVRRFSWHAVVLIALVVLFLWDNEKFLRHAQDINDQAAQAIGDLTPSKIATAFAERRATCDYRWLFVCGERPRDCLPTLLSCDDSLSPLAIAEKWGLLGHAWNTARGLATLPDGAWHVLAQNFGAGIVPFVMTLIFVGLNVFFAMRLPPLTWPLTLPLAAFASSCLYWVVQYAFLFAADGVWLLLKILLFVALVPEGLITLFEWLRAGHEVHGIAHKAAEAKAALRHLK